MRKTERQTAELFRAVLDAVERGELEAESPDGRVLVRHIEGAIAALDPAPKLPG